MGLRNQLDFSPQLGIGAFSSYPDLVYAPHTYTHSFTKKIPIPFTNITYQPPYALSLDTAWAEADGMNASVLVTEFGAPRADERLEGIVREQDRHFTGSTFWPWKERGGWGMFTHTDNATDQNGPIDPGHVDLLARVTPLAVSGRLLGFEYNYSNHTFAMAASGDGRARAPTEVFIPAHVGEVAVRVAGAATLLNVTRAPDEARTAFVDPGRGAYAVALAPAEVELDVLVARAWTLSEGGDRGDLMSTACAAWRGATGELARELSGVEARCSPR
jgi:hypothetical protein